MSYSQIARRLRRGFAGGFLSALVGTFEPDILLDFSQQGGGQLVDVSGNERHFTIDGTEGVDFTWKGNTSHLANAKGRVEILGGASWTSDAVFSGNHTWITGAKADMTATAGYLFDIELARFLLRGSTGIIGYAGASSDTTPYDAALDNEYLYGVRRNATEIRLFINGLAVFDAPAVALSFSTGIEWAIGQRIGTGSNTASGDYEGLFFYKNDALTDDEIYQIYVDASEQRHFFKDVVIDELGVAGSCEAYHPFFETDGTTGFCLDVSGSENHATFASGPVLGGEGVDDGHLYSIGGPTGSVTMATLIDVATDDFTVAGACGPDPSGSGGDGLAVFGATAQYIGLFVNYSANNIRAQVNAGGAGIANTTFDGIPNRFAWCLRRSGAAVSLWINGAKQADFTITVAPASSTIHRLRTWGHDGIGTFQGAFNHRGTFSAALSDAACARLATL